MAGKSTISITFKLQSDGKGFKELSKDADGLKKAMTAAVTEAGQLKSSLINFAAVTTGIRNAQAAIMDLQNSLQGLADSYYKSEEQKTKLLTVMRQRMTATDQEVASVNRLIGAQTELGVLGGTVQRAGAQQLATFLKTSSSLEKLIPAMNNLVVQQRGLNAETGDAVSVANLMGKAMTGQTSALRRVGIIFTEAQAEVLKYGNEEERAATLAQVITDNVGEMNKAIGNTKAGQIKQIKNEFGAWKVQMGEIASNVMPALNTATGVLGVVLMTLQINTATSSMLQWAKSLSFATAATKLKAIALKGLNAATIIWNTTAKFVTGTNTALGVSGYGAAAGLTALKMAIRGLFVATGVGIVIAVLTTAVEALLNAMDGSDQQTDKLTDGLTDAQRAARETAQTFEQTSAQTYGQLKTRYAELQNAWKRLTTEHQKNAWIKDNQSAFKDLGVSVNSVKDAEDVFVKNTSKVEEAFKKRAEAAANAAVLTELYEQKLRLELAINKRDQDAQNRHKFTPKKQGDVISDNDEYFSSLQGGNYGNKYKYVNQAGQWALTEEGAKKYNQHYSSQRWYANSTEQKNDRRQLADTNAQINEVSKKVAENPVKPYAPTQTSTPKSGGKSGSGDKPLTEISNPLSENDYQNNLRYYEEQRAKVDMTSEAYANWCAKIKETQAALDKLKGEGSEKTVVANPTSVNDYENNLSVLREKQKAATSPEDYATLQKQIDDTTEALKRFKGEAEETYKPGAITELNTIEQLDKAISHYQEQQTKQTATEIENTQRTIDALEAKRNALQRGTEIPAMQKEIADISALSGREFKMKVKGIGFDALTDKIRELQAMLNDTQNPVTGDQRKEIEDMIGTYEQWRKSSISAFDTMKSGWSGIKGIGDSISGITEALDSDANAWQKITAVVDGFIQLYESISMIVEIVQMITAATSAYTAAKAAEATATTASAAATTGDAATKAAAATAAIPAVAVNKALAASYMQLAASIYAAAYASIPFAGPALSAGFSAQAVATAIASAAAIMASPFAKGGIVSGPTLALVGEYAGAGNNPEVIAPLDKLRSMLQPQGVGVGGNIRMEVKGRKLVGVLANETRISSKSGRKTNIQI